MKHSTKTENSALTAQHSVLCIVLCAVLFALCISAQAQEPAKSWKIGVLVSGSRESNSARDQGLRQGLHDLGYDEGKNIVLEYRFAEGKLDRLPQLARELVEKKPEV